LESIPKENGTMFQVYCPDHGSQVLLDNGRIRGMRATADGPVLDWECWCGRRGSLAGGRNSAGAARRGEHVAA
jgi:hypothetical protein